MTLQETGESRGAAPLAVSRELAARLHQAGIRYCHFKSNDHVLEGMQGTTDLDVLVDRRSGPALQRILADLDYRRFTAPPGLQYPAVEDYLGFDSPTGRLVHLHLHHELTSGEAHLKGYRLPWEQVVLADRRLDEATRFYVADPAIDFLLLIVRTALKVRIRDRILGPLGRSALTRHDRHEYRWLSERLDRARLADRTRDLLGDAARMAILEMLERGPSWRSVLEFRKRALPVLRLCRTYAPVEARLRRWGRGLVRLRAATVGRMAGSLAPRSRLVPRGGLVVAVVGADGSGKSSLVQALAQWLSWKVDARTVYFGSGDGPSSALRWPFKITLRALRAAGLVRRREAGSVHPAAAGGEEGALRPPAGLAGAARAVWALLLALEKRSALRRTRRGRNRGMVMICDRYPQNRIMDFNDGPLLSHWRSRPAGPRRALAIWEARPYEWTETAPPDLLLRLSVDPEVARSRKPDMPLAELRRRARAVAALAWSPGAEVADLDAGRPFAEVLLEAKRRLWNAL